MNYRSAARLGFPVSEVGCGMWGAGGWTGTDDTEYAAALDRAVALGCTFFDTALAYGDGRSERLLGELLRRHPHAELRIASKVPPKNRQWPGRATTAAGEVFPYDHVIDSTETSLRNLGVEAMDLQQLHVWDDAWTADEGWRRAVAVLKRTGKIRAFGISVNRWEPANVLAALQTGLVDSVQVVYNLFDQAPEDALFPECRRLGVAVIARVPFDEGSLTGTLTPASTWPDGDWRNSYFSQRHLADTLVHVADAQRHATGLGLPLPELALRFILANPDVTTTIPGMRTRRHVEGNLAVTGEPALPPGAIDRLRPLRWDRTPDDRS